jgi:DNA-binding transcriptional ArsR family regulator
VTMIAATQRPTQKAMGQGAVRSQMDIRICFRVRERKDVDLVLGQGMLSSGWHAHTLNAPGKFLISAAEHQTPKRARGFLVTDQAVSETAARYALRRPELDQESRRAIGQPFANNGDTDGLNRVQPQSGTSDQTFTAEDTLWLALSMAPNDGAEIGELTRLTGMSRPTLYRHLAQLAKSGRVVQVTRGHWRAATTDEP